jgi:hypothetical protein
MSYKDVESSVSYFLAYITTTIAVSTGANANLIVPFASTTYNNGTDFSTSTYKYMAPTNGLYHFNASMVIANDSSSTSDDTMQWGIATSNTTVSSALLNDNWENISVSTTNTWPTSLTMVLQLNANETVWVVYGNNNTTQRFIGGSSGCTFSGHLICPFK